MAGVYEMSFKLRHLSTSTKKGGKPPSVSATVAKAKDRIAYITREDGAIEDADIILAHDGQIRRDLTRDEARSIMRQATEERAKKHRKGGVGVRLMDTIMVSLPNDATPDERRKMAGKMVGHLVGQSEAHALAAIHTDKAGNSHLHIAYLDGLETAEQARIRNPDAKRVRRMEYGKLNEGGKPKELRRELAGIINSVGKKEGRRKAEHRSFKDRGMKQQPQRHEGVQVHDKAARQGVPQLTPGAAARLDDNLTIIATRTVQAHGREAPQHMPRRYMLSPHLYETAQAKLSGFLSQFKPAPQLTAPGKGGGLLSRAAKWFERKPPQEAQQRPQEAPARADALAEPQPRPQAQPEPFLTYEEERQRDAMRRAHKESLKNLTGTYTVKNPRPEGRGFTSRPAKKEVR